MRLRETMLLFCAAPWLGHGRATECFLAMTALFYAVVLTLVPGAVAESRATFGLAWLGYQNWLVVCLFAKAVLTGVGLVLNITGLLRSPHWGKVSMAGWIRFAGAWVGFLIWVWLTTQFVLADSVASIGFPFCVMAALFSLRIMALSLAGLPPSGAPAQI